MNLLANLAPVEHGSSLLVAELVIIAGVAIAAKRMRLPYTIALVTAGLFVGILRAESFFELGVTLTPELVFTVFLPVLLFEAAFNLSSHHLKENIRPITLLAVPGVILASLGVGYGLHYGLGMPLPSALVFGALISATDPISVLALFKQLKAPSRLATIVEGESLFNDGAAVVVFKILLGLALTGEFSLAMGALQFFGISLGGLACGALLGYAASRLTKTIDDHLIEITLSTILAYGSFLVAEHIGASGVMAVIAAGLVFGNYGKPVGMSANTQLMMRSFWEYAGFLMNSLVFLLIGTQVDLRLLATRWKLVLAAFLCVVLVRLLVIVLVSLVWRQVAEPVSLRWRAVIVWAGLRGSISMALAIGLPSELPWRDEILLMTFGVVILSLYAQGLSMPRLLRALDVIAVVPDEVAAYEKKLARLLMSQHALKSLQGMRDNHSLSQEVYKTLAAPYEHDTNALVGELSVLAQSHEAIRQEQLRDGRHAATTAQLAALRRAEDQGLVSGEVAEEVLRELAENASQDQMGEADLDLPLHSEEE